MEGIMSSNNQLNGYKPLGEIVFEHLKKEILNGDLKPGERLMESALANELGVSRTPVREAIRKLEKENFVKMVPRKGAYVTELTNKDIIEVLELRVVLEGFAAQLAAERISSEEVKELQRLHDHFNRYIEKKDKAGLRSMDAKFHQGIYQATRNNKLVEMIVDLHDQFQRFRLSYYNEIDDYRDIYNSHDRILKAIESGDVKKAKQEAEKHILIIKENFINWQNKEEQ
jgi:DNA-binding GntR family transcriptional regulator